MTIGSMKLGAAPDAVSTETKPGAAEENTEAFAQLLTSHRDVEPETPRGTQRAGADLPPEEMEPQMESIEIPIDVEVDLEGEVSALTEPKRGFWERATSPNEQLAKGNRPVRAAERTPSFDVRILERQGGAQSEAVVPGPRSGNAPRPILSAADAALPTTTRPASAETAAPVKEALRAPAIPDIPMVEEAEPVRARPAPAPSPPMSVSLQLATIAHDVLARAAQIATPEADAQVPHTTVTVRPPTQSAGQDAFIHIEHPELGRIRLQLMLESRNLRVRAVATSAAAVAALRESEEAMREDVARHGVDLGSLRVDLRRRTRDEEK